MLRALAVTGGVITSAGIVLAGTFSVLAVLPLVFLTEIGFVVAFGVLLDTFLVRSVLVPALVLRDRAEGVVAVAARARGGDPGEAGDEPVPVEAWPAGGRLGAGRVRAARRRAAAAVVADYVEQSQAGEGPVVRRRRRRAGR